MRSHIKAAAVEPTKFCEFCNCEHVECMMCQGMAEEKGKSYEEVVFRSYVAGMGMGMLLERAGLKIPPGLCDRHATAIQNGKLKLPPVS